MHQKTVAILFYLLLSALMGWSGLYPKRSIALLNKMYGLLGINLTFTPKGERVVRALSFFLMLLFLAGSLFLALLE